VKDARSQSRAANNGLNGYAIAPPAEEPEEEAPAAQDEVQEETAAPVAPDAKACELEALHGEPQPAAPPEQVVLPEALDPSDTQ